MTYAEKLQDPRWQKKRLKILERDEWKCRLCFDTNATLHIHHKKYHKEPWDVDNDFLITYCKHCHVFVEENDRDDELVRTTKIYMTNGSLVLYAIFINKEKEYYVETYFFDKNDNISYWHSILAEDMESLLRMINRHKNG